MYVERLIPAYYKGFAEFASITEADIKNSKDAVRDFILVACGFRWAQRHMFTESVEKKSYVEKELQNIYDLKL